MEKSKIVVNNLAAVYPKLAAEWHPTKNGNLKPTDVAAGSGKKVWWYLPYDDSNTGKHFDFEWIASIHERTNNGCGCPYLSGKAIWIGFNDLETTHPQIAKEWHPTKNGNLKPTDVSSGCNKKVWWYLPYDDPKTRKHFDFEWEATIFDRTKGYECPFLFGRKIWTGFNDFVTYCRENHFEYILKEWHPTKNGDLKPTDITVGSRLKVWWHLPYDDSKTGKHFDFEWESTIANRIKGNNCPYLSGHDVWIGFNDLQTVNPQLAAEWHPTKNGDLKPTDVTAKSNKKVWWLLPYDDPKTGKHFDFEWQTYIRNRMNGSGCPYLSVPIKSIWKGFNDLGTYCKLNNIEYILDEWDYNKNKNLKPSDLTYGSTIEVWWKCPKNHTYKAKVSSRTLKHCNCPICAKELSTSFPEQAIYFYLKQKFNDAQNKWVENKVELDIKIPSIVTAVEHDGQLFHQDINKDLKKNKYCNDNDIMLYRIREHKCPHMKDNKFLKVFTYNPRNESELEKIIVQLGECLNVKLDVDINRDRAIIYNQYINVIKEDNLLKKYPQIAAEWHPTKNGNITPDMISSRSNKKVWWHLPYDDPRTGKHFDFEWEATIYHRTCGKGCPYLSGRAVLKGFNDLQTVVPQLASEWHPTKNGDLKPTDVTVGSEKKVWWYLPYDDPKTGKHFDFEWECSIGARVRGIGCPYLCGKLVWIGFNDLMTTHPNIAAQWHPTKNGDLKPTDVTAGSGLKVWWYLPYDDPQTGKHYNFEWQTTIYNRTRGDGCPYLSHNPKVWQGFNDLQTVFPQLASEWHPTKNGDLKPTDVTVNSNKKVWWIKPNGDVVLKSVCSMVKIIKK